MNSPEVDGSDILGRCGACVVGRLEKPLCDNRLRFLLEEGGRQFPSPKSDMYR